MLFVCGCSGYRTYVDTGAGAKAPDGLVMRILAVRATADGLEIEYELRNDAPRSFWYRGDASSGRPELRYQSLTERAWIWHPGNDCGFGIGDVELAPGERRTFTTQISFRNRLQRIRIGIHERDGRFVLWSGVIDPVILRAGR